MERVNLSNQKWNLFYQDNLSSDCGKIECQVPGNVELDLIRAGLLPENLFYSTNVKAVTKYESYDWEYSCTFDCNNPTARHKLVFAGVDCVAEYFVNDDKIGESENMFVEHEFWVNNLKPKNNKLVVKIHSTYIRHNNMDFSALVRLNDWGAFTAELSGLRRAGHTYGWDIMPRIVSAGIFRDVYLVEVSDYEIDELYIDTFAINKNRATIFFNYQISSNAYIRENSGFTIKATGKCGESTFEKTVALYTKASYFSVSIPDAKLWWPYGYGDQNLYDITVAIYQNGKELASKTIRYGIRTCKLEYCDEPNKETFGFVVNGVKVYARGTNWTPSSPFHSQDKEKLYSEIDNLKELHCNMVRMWGGTVYECDEFYQKMDELGIMVWQDFAFACSFYPQTEEYFSTIRDEIVKVVKRLRNFSCIVAWAGDNENDEFSRCYKVNPNYNRLNREIIPNLIQHHDLYRPYIVSSPFVSNNVHEKGYVQPEQHIWANRPYYKSPYYAKNNACFSSEIGIPAVANLESLKKFISPENLDNFYSEDWLFHSAERLGREFRINYLENQCTGVFGRLATTAEEFIKMSQFTQAEALKYLIERMRMKRPYASGLLFWNLHDGWPQSTEAVVDYYGCRKKAFETIKHAHQPVCFMCNDEGHLFVDNDTLQKQDVSYEVVQWESGDVLAKGNIHVEENISIDLGKIFDNDKHGLVILRWNINGKTFTNHFIQGQPNYTLDEFEKWYSVLKEID